MSIVLRHVAEIERLSSVYKGIVSLLVVVIETMNSDETVERMCVRIRSDWIGEDPRT